MFRSTRIRRKIPYHQMSGYHILRNFNTSLVLQFEYVYSVGTLRPGQARHTHLCSYRANLKNVCECIILS
jgi:hypothetical protein